jgi:Flp pilus assembly protein TadB
MTAGIGVGVIAGLGVVLILRGLRRDAPEMADLVARYSDVSSGYGLPPAPVSPERHNRPLLTRLGAALATAAARSGTPLAPPEDLAMLERSADHHFAATGLSAIGLAGAAAVAVSVSAHVGLPIPAVGIPIACAVGAAVGIAAPAIEVRRAARRERECFVRALGCWLELVAMAQAGGMGIESALEASSEISSDRSFGRLSTALGSVRLTGDPWSALARLGAELGVTDLEELAATLALAGTEGARVRTSLAAKAASLRRRQMADAEAEANATTERLFLPSIVMMIAFLIFLMYPAGARLAHVF